MHADALETQTRRDSVDVLLRAALSPAADPLLAAFARTPATANLLAAFIGQGTPLVRALPSAEDLLFTSNLHFKWRAGIV